MNTAVPSEKYLQSVGIDIGYNRWLSLRGFGWPMATLEVTDSALTISWWNQRWAFPKASVRRLVRQRGIVYDGFRIEHSVPGAMPYVVIRTFRFDNLWTALAHRGWYVSSELPNLG